MAVKSMFVRDALAEDFSYEIPTGMIDVVFLLLLFFLAAARFKMSDNKLDLELPKGGPNQGPGPEVEREFRIKVDGTDPAKPLFMLDSMPLANVGELVVRLKVAAATLPYVSVLVVGKPKTPFVYVVWALDACKQAQIDDAKFEAFSVPGLGLPVEDQI